MSGRTLLFDKSLEKITFTFHYAGLLLDTKTKTFKEKIKTRCIYLLNISWAGFDVTGSIYWFIDGIMKGKRFIDLTYIAPCIGLSSLAFLKAIILTVNEKRVDELIDSIRYLESTEKQSEIVEKKESIIADERRFLNNIINTLNIFNVIMIVTFSSCPLVLMLIEYLKTKEFELMLPFLVVYPFNSYDIRYWPFVYMHQFWSGCVVMLDTYSADYLLFTFCTYIRIHFRLLQYDMGNIIPGLGNNTAISFRDEVFKNKFVNLVKRHQMCIRSVYLLEAIYTKSILYNFLSSSILICLTGFNVVAIEDMALIFTFLIFLSTCLLQVYLLCFFGDMLMQSSTAVCDAAYNCSWYSADAVIGKSMLIVLTRAQKPCKLTAMGFADVNLMAFTSILRNSWSCFCLLNTMYTP
ncbi:unnamed protein product [Parnassius mnemosyne]|uniref:Odorant receptor n=1 Tax=Parnassius mnemosyne TaxID=213953 RepID=A0AAV1L337_9NEOP